MFAAAVIWDRGLYASLVSADSSHLCLVMSVIFAGTNVHAGVLAWRLAQHGNELQTLLERLPPGDGPVLIADLDACDGRGKLLSSYFRAVAGRAPAGSISESMQLTDVLTERVRGAHALGWHLTDMLVKLGLLGTVIGFMIVMGSVASLESFDIENAQHLMTSMMDGMGVALNTTLFGFVCGMLAGLQYLLLDHAADSLLADAVYIAESRLTSSAAGSVAGGLQA